MSGPAVLAPFARAALALGALVDLWSLYAWIRRRRLGRGPSGLPGFALICYLSYCAWRRSLAILGALLLFHAACHYALPRLFARRPS